MHKADSLLILTTLLAAAGWLFSKQTLQGLPPFTFLGYRFFIAGAILLLFAIPVLKQVNVKQYLMMIAIGFSLGISLVTWILGLQHSQHIGEGSFLTSLGIIFAPVWSQIFFAERTSMLGWISLLTALVGVALLTLNNGFTIELGQLFFIASGLLFGLYFSLNSHYSSSSPIVLLSAIQLLISGILGLLFAFALEAQPTHVGFSIWAWLAASILISSCLRFYVQVLGQSLTSVAHASLIMILEPIWVVLIGVVWFDESMTLMQVIGCSVIFSSLLLNRIAIIYKNRGL